MEQSSNNSADRIDALMREQMQQSGGGPGGTPRSVKKEPALNLPSSVIFLGIVFILVHAFRTYVLTNEQDYQLILQFSFIPAFFTFPLDQVPFPASRYWSFVSYAFLHGDWTHVFVNLLWMVAFGSAVAKRFGTARFLGFTFFAAVAGAVAHFVMHPEDVTPVIGASACVSAYMGAAIRFIMAPGALGAGRSGGSVYHPPALSLAQALTNRNVILFVGVWFGLNLLFGTGIIPLAGEGVQIAWEAHVGGFLFGLIAFSAFDPVGRK